MFQLELQVRDYECDTQGIVNNAVYNNYFEHARHHFLKKHGIDFMDLARKGILLVLYRAEIDYKIPLKADQIFQITVSLQRLSKIKCVFEQTIRIADKLYTTGQFYTTVIDDNRKPMNLDLAGFVNFFQPPPRSNANPQPPAPE